MSNPPTKEAETATDAPMCECGEGVLVPAMTRAGDRKPNPHAHHMELCEMVCSASGDKLVVRTSRVIAAWFSAGAQEQKLSMPVTALQARAEELLEQTTTQETAEQLAMIAQAFKALSCAVQVSLDPNKWSDAGLHFEELAEQYMRPVVAWQGGQ